MGSSSRYQTCDKYTQTGNTSLKDAAISMWVGNISNLSHSKIKCLSIRFNEVLKY
jgi:hypothetical protein